MKSTTLAGVVAAVAMAGTLTASETVAPSSMLLDVSIRRGGFEILSSAQVRAAAGEVAHIQLDDRYKVHVIPRTGKQPREIILEVLIEDVQAKAPRVHHIHTSYGSAIPLPLEGDRLERLELVAWSR